MGWAVIGEDRVLAKSWMRARSRSGERAWGKPDSTRAMVVPAWRMTWVLAGPSIASLGPLGGTVATLLANARVRTHRLR